MIQFPKRKGLSYIEDTRKHHHILDEIAKEASRNAIKIAKENGVSICYLRGNEVVEEDSNGEITIIEVLDIKQIKIADKEFKKNKKS